MKIKKGFIKRKILQDFVVVPTGKANKDKRVIIRLNQTGSDIWECVASGKTVEQTAEFLNRKYDVTVEKALVSVNSFVGVLKKENLLEDE